MSRQPSRFALSGRFVVSEPVGEIPLLRWCSLVLADEVAARFARTRGTPADRCRAVWVGSDELVRGLLRERRDEALEYAGRLG